MSDREEQLKADIRALQKRLADAQKPVEIVKRVEVPVTKYVDRVREKVIEKPVHKTIYKPSPEQEKEIANLRGKIERMGEIKARAPETKTVYKTKEVPVEVIKYVDRVKTKRVERVVYKTCRKQEARIAELEAEVSRLERECLDR